MWNEILVNCIRKDTKKVLGESKEKSNYNKNTCWRSRGLGSHLGGKKILLQIMAEV